MKFESFEDVERWEKNMKILYELEEGNCVKCGSNFETAVKSRGGAWHDPEMKEDKWMCVKCHDPEAFEFEKKVKKLLKANKLFLKCPECEENMDMIFSYHCECGYER